MTLCFLGLLGLVGVVFASVPVLKTIHGTATVSYLDDVAITGFEFISDTEVSVSLETSTALDCMISVSGAGISGTESVVVADWSGSPLTVTKSVTVSGTLTAGVIVIEVV